jgi:hypothetical protein
MIGHYVTRVRERRLERRNIRRLQEYLAMLPAPAGNPRDVLADLALIEGRS